MSGHGAEISPPHHDDDSEHHHNHNSDLNDLIETSSNEHKTNAVTNSSHSSYCSSSAVTGINKSDESTQTSTVCRKAEVIASGVSVESTDSYYAQSATNEKIASEGSDDILSFRF